MNDTNLALVQGIGKYLDNLDGGSRSVDDVVQFLADVALSVRPDILTAIGGK